MDLKNIHKFEVNSEESFVSIQKSLVKKIRLINRFKEEIKLCAGIDLAYWEKGEEHYAVCCIVVINYKTKKEVEKVYSYGKINVPYVAGFLAFRELPLIVEAAKKLTLEPDIFIFDGNGYLHFNHMGIATHASFFLNKPTIGVAKSYLKIGGVDFNMPQNDEGSYNDIVINGEVYGRVLRTRKDVKPIFISCGNYIDLETCTKIVSELVNKESRLPIPVRLADLETHIMRNELKKLI
ncbi:endonuclease V [Clostridium estertheticum]|uniref:Endonuclease V n=1 Tax=Clostridium estertheticum TaxID=238834 RepID=A0AA47EKZ5_9CLOT|nr:endonuclease V [Clostridium estertheticum]MBU3157934.1 endonuclease V [Clostridium estertheticum]MBU3202425.1 endonuclease V [Clostridium estertheticum]WAG62142.1 endonuclease V [Clostridium estertheticum]WAG63741.1 endonuclease V [Clostridium estertheticum]